MEPGTNARLGPEAHRRERRKVFMACLHCRGRKVGCDKKSPACSSCASRGLKCQYLPIRKMRGPGKKKKNADNLQCGSTFLQIQRHDREELAYEENESSINNGSFAAVGDLPEYQVHLDLSDEFMNLDALLQETFPVFLDPGNNILDLQNLKRAVNEKPKSPEGFTPLISQDEIRHIFEITYDEIATVYPMFDLPTLNRLNAEQHAVSSTSPAGSPARWAIINTWIAMGVRLKTVPGTEADMDCVTKSYYRNTVLVLPDLILQPASKEAIQALLLMAVYAESSLDHRSYVMLVTNAVRQIEFLAPRLAEAADRCEMEACQKSLSFAQSHDMKVASKYGMTLLLGSLVF